MYVHVCDSLVHMSTERTLAKGIRLPDSLWSAIDCEARSLKMTRNEYLSRRLGSLFAAPGDVPKSIKSVHGSPDADALELLE